MIDSELIRIFDSIIPLISVLFVLPGAVYVAQYLSGRRPDSVLLLASITGIIMMPMLSTALHNFDPQSQEPPHVMSVHYEEVIDKEMTSSIDLLLWILLELPIPDTDYFIETNCTTLEVYGWEYREIRIGDTYKVTTWSDGTVDRELIG